MSAISQAFGNITEILTATATLMPAFLVLLIAIVPILLIITVVGMIRGWFGDFGKMFKFGKK